MNNFLNLISLRILRITVYSTIAMAFCAWIIQSSRYLSMLNGGISLSVFFKFTSFLFADIIAFILPIAFSISAAFVFYRLKEYNQIIALQAAGISPRKLLRPLMTLGCIITGYLYISNMYISPMAWIHFRKMEFNIRNNIEVPSSAGQIFTSSKFSVYAHQYLGDFTFKNIFVIDTRETHKTHSMFAQFGTIKNNTLILKNGERLEVNYANHKNSTARFNYYSYDLKGITGFQEQKPRANEKFMQELLIKTPRNESKFKEQLSMFHQKILSPLLTIIFALAAFILVVLSPYTRKHSYTRIAILIALLIIAEGIFLTFTNIAMKDEIFNFINYGFVGIMLLLSLVAALGRE